MITNYSQALSYLRRSVPSGSKRFPGSLGLDRQKEILRRLNNPQDKIKTIHIAGTSGKGSTASYLSSLLVGQGFNVGLTVSPHLLDVRERFQINNQLISQKEFVIYLNQIIPVIEEVKKTNFGKPTFFEILIALAFYIFHQKQVDYAVVETGLGGLSDGSNVINSSNKVVVLTKIGLDHTNILGPNLTTIATQKAGIIHPHNPCFSIHQTNSVKQVFDQAATQNQTIINYISRQNISHVQSQNFNLIYDFSFQGLSLKSLIVNSIGLYQTENSALALSVVKFLSDRDKFVLDIKNIYQSIFDCHFSGRADIQKIKQKTLILDGAHNPQKMRSLVKSLKLFFPGQKFTFLLAFKQRKDFSKMIKMILPIADQVVLTKFKVTSQDMIQLSQPQLSLNRLFTRLNFFNFKNISDQSEALNFVLTSNNPIVVTGSLYLLGEIYPLLN
ncbi:MAG: Mur ligase family protein, partial [Candidatus Shapirobacteria bacterium]|nr:Mur ligase family protein [Candidatus Shapirobacteria bacterium]